MEKLLLTILSAAVSYYPLCGIVGLIRYIRGEELVLSHRKVRYEMKKDEVMEILEHNWTCLKNQAYTDNELDEALEYIIKALEQEPNHGWHPSSEAPESRGMFLVTRNYGKGDEIEIAHYTEDMRVVDEYDYADTRRGGWYRYDPEYGNYEIDNVVAWMKLPEVYKEG